MTSTPPPADVALAELQRTMIAALLTPSTDPGATPDATPARQAAASLIRADGLEPAQRLAVYANTVRVNFRAALASTYPVLERLVGAEYFATLVDRYGQEHPSLSGDLNRAGDSLAQFLDQLHGADEYAYLPHVARFEWACQEALLAAPHPPLDLAALAAVPSAEYENLQFLLHPSLRLFDSPYPVRAIWQANLDPDVEPPPIDLGAGGERLAILRPALDLSFLPLGAGEAACLGTLAAGEPLGAALEAGAGDPDFDAGAALPRFAATGVLVGFRSASRGPAILDP